MQQRVVSYEGNTQGRVRLFVDEKRRKVVLFPPLELKERVEELRRDERESKGYIITFLSWLSLVLRERQKKKKESLLRPLLFNAFLEVLVG